ncbi:MAG: hypothetical protein ACE5JB_15590 [bacterium]
MNSEGSEFGYVEKYLDQLHNYKSQIDHFFEKFKDEYEAYIHERSPAREVDLKSSIAYFEKYLKSQLIDIHKPEKVYGEPFVGLEVLINQEWRSYEFRHLFQGIDYLNKLNIVRHKLISKSPDLRISHSITRSKYYRYSLLYYYLDFYEEIQVKQVSFASPGFITFEGLEHSIKELRKLLRYICKFKFVRDFVDLYDHFKFDRPIKNVERRMKLKDLLHKESLLERKWAKEELTEFREFLDEINKFAVLAEELEQKGLAKGSLVEESFIRSISMLHRLGFDKEKLNIV